MKNKNAAFLFFEGCNVIGDLKGNKSQLTVQKLYLADVANAMKAELERNNCALSEIFKCVRGLDCFLSDIDKRFYKNQENAVRYKYDALVICKKVAGEFISDNEIRKLFIGTYESNSGDKEDFLKYVGAINLAYIKKDSSQSDRSSEKSQAQETDAKRQADIKAFAGTQTGRSDNAQSFNDKEQIKDFTGVSDAVSKSRDFREALKNMLKDDGGSVQKPVADAVRSSEFKDIKDVREIRMPQAFYERQEKAELSKSQAQSPQADSKVYAAPVQNNGGKPAQNGNGKPELKEPLTGGKSEAASSVLINQQKAAEADLAAQARFAKAAQTESQAAPVQEKQETKPYRVADGRIKKEVEIIDEIVGNKKMDDTILKEIDLIKNIIDGAQSVMKKQFEGMDAAFNTLNKVKDEIEYEHIKSMSKQIIPIITTIERIVQDHERYFDDKAISEDEKRAAGDIYVEYEKMYASNKTFRDLLVQALRSFGVEEIKSRPGTEFNEEIHKPVNVKIAHSRNSVDKVTKCVSPGYSYRKTILLLEKVQIE